MSSDAFERVQRQDMESFRAYDTAGFVEVHDPGAISIFGNGAVSRGMPEIMASLEGHFTRKEATWTWREAARRVHLRHTAVIVYETAYVEPSSGFRQDAITSVAYTYQNGTWRALLDQSTALGRT